MRCPVCWFILLSSVVLDVTAITRDESKVFGLQTDFHQPRSAKSYIRYDFGKRGAGGGEGGGGGGGEDIDVRGAAATAGAAANNPDQLSKATICYRVWIQQYRDIVPFLSYAYSDKADNGFLAFQYNTILDFYYKDLKEPTNLVMDDTLEIWHHYCFVFTHPSYRIYVDGILEDEGRLKADTPEIPLNGTLYFGQEQDKYDGGLERHQSLSGYLTQVNIWDRPLNSKTIKEIASCNANPQGNIFASDTTEVEESEVVTSILPYKNFCEYREKFVIIPQQMTSYDAEKFCDLADAKFYIPGNKRENERLFNESRQFSQECNGKSYQLMFLGSSDEAKEGHWIKMADGKPLSFTAWYPGEPNGGRKGNCVVLRKQEDKWSDVLCNGNLCFPCGRTNQDFLQLRGLCQSHEHETRMHLDGYINSKPYFLGYYRYLIYHSGEKEWILKDLDANVTLAVLSLFKGSEYPIGRRSWKVNNTFCDYPVGKSIVLGLSKCSTQQFMCTDGSCVSRSVRCDLRDDCRDSSDEENCTIVDFGSQYHNHRPPPGDAFNVPLGVVPLVHLIRFSKIDDINLAFHMEFEIALAWTDRNLRFKNIKEQEGKNRLSKKEVSTIWSPETEFLNVNDGNLQRLKSGVYVRMVGEADLPIFKDVKMDTIYQAASGRLVQRTQYYASFNCNFRLFRYPFDTQRCTILVKLASADRNVIDFQNASVLYSGLKKLTKYEVKNVAIEMKPSQDNYAVLEVMFDLERRWSLLVLTVFVPTFLLLGIGYGTLYIKLAVFQVRAIMTLTTLLVLYTMFNQVSSALPDTAYIKMVDMWFFFCIFLIFSVIVIHVTVERLEPGDEAVKSKPLQVAPFAPQETGVLKSFKERRFRLTATSLMKVTRKYIFPTIVLTFGIMFWAVILTA